MVHCLLLNENKQERHESHKKTSTAFTLPKPLFRVGMNVILGPSSAERHQAACLGFSAAQPAVPWSVGVSVYERGAAAPSGGQKRSQSGCPAHMQLSNKKFGSGDIGSTDVHMAH